MLSGRQLSPYSQTQQQNDRVKAFIDRYRVRKSCSQEVSDEVDITDLEQQLEVLNIQLQNKKIQTQDVISKKVEVKFNEIKQSGNHYSQKQYFRKKKRSQTLFTSGRQYISTTPKQKTKKYSNDQRPIARIIKENYKLRKRINDLLLEKQQNILRHKQLNKQLNYQICNSIIHNIICQIPDKDQNQANQILFKFQHLQNTLQSPWQQFTDYKLKEEARLSQLEEELRLKSEELHHS